MDNENVTEDIGEIQIANEVVASIAGISASEVDGIDMLNGTFSNELAGKFGVRNNAKGVRIEVDDDEAIVSLDVTVKYGYSIPEVCANVQDKVASAIASMTGLKCTKVDVNITGVSLPKD